MIPARMESSRFPGKPLAPISGIPMVVYCAKNAIATGLEVFVCTDSKEIKFTCEKFGANCLMTSDKCLTGTDRGAEVSRVISAKQYINLQGDEPIFPSDEIKYFLEKCTINPSKVHTAIISIKNKYDFHNNSIPKMVFTKQRKLLYSSRAPIPANKNGEFNFGYKHV